MICPYCKSEGAYVGHLTVECVNGDCKYYSLKWDHDSSEDEFEAVDDLDISQRPTDPCPPPNKNGDQLPLAFDWSAWNNVKTKCDRGYLKINDFTEVQPMLLPTALMFYLDYKFGVKKS